ncbi:DUF5977 domain-containing protein [Flavobacterium ginsenosidimutans]|uniref:DUF5977 domain-containing protein n=1 Tax=Flavobacterium ginsenosidimutans TaxID=687844 RepID=UPI000DAF4382|nr:DUF5977 domain-containing protein [Flavobacterium ginsenosidimutans]KAF2330542.1 hypothetical protein DM444_14460 [Flavobacterium ginsenosidimutans]
MEENITYKPFAYIDQYSPAEGTTVYYNTEKTLAVKKNDCSYGTAGNLVTLTAPANKFVSTESVADADEQAQAWLTANAQAYANNTGICSIRTTAWRGENPSCVLEPSTSLLPFDYMIVKYKWAFGAGADLDTFTGLINTGIDTLDNKWVGYGLGSEVPANTSSQDSYVMWGGDVQDLTGTETCLINFKKLKEDYSSLNDIQVRMAGVWWSSKNTGNIDVEITTYLGGTMTKVDKDIVNSNGQQIQQLNFSKNVSVKGTHLAIDQATNIGYINYSSNSSTANIVINY